MTKICNKPTCANNTTAIIGLRTKYCEKHTCNWGICKKREYTDGFCGKHFAKLCKKGVSK